MDVEFLEFKVENTVSSEKPEGFPSNENLIQLPLKVNLLKQAPALYYGKFYFSGLKKGQGITVANALRRVLLYDLFGIGITKTKFSLDSENTSKDLEIHEFSSISGMKESLLEFLIHLRSIVWVKPDEKFESFSGKLYLEDILEFEANSQAFKNPGVMNEIRHPESFAPQDLRSLETFGRNESTEGNDFSRKSEFFILQAKHLLFESKKNSKLLPENCLKIVNPEQYLATFVPLRKDGKLSSFPKFEMEFQIQNGVLDVPSTLVSDEFLVEPGPFFPIKKVNYTVELEKQSTQSLNSGREFGSSLPNECVFFEIWTDGSIHPENALKKAFFILETLFKQ